MTDSFIDANSRKRLRRILDENENTFVKIGGEWHLIENKSNDLYRDDDGNWIVKTVTEEIHEGRIFAKYVLKVLENK